MHVKCVMQLALQAAADGNLPLASTTHCISGVPVHVYLEPAGPGVGPGGPGGGRGGNFPQRQTLVGGQTNAPLQHSCLSFELQA